MRDALRVALEAALVENPDDLANYMAYADYLSEQGEPRGEFIQVQLALEDASLTAARRKKLREREIDLLHEHEREWLGGLATHLIDKDAEHLKEAYSGDQTYTYSWQRGFLASVEVRFLTRRFAQALVYSPVAKLLRELRAFDDLGGQDIEIDPPMSLAVLFRPAWAVNHYSNLFELLDAACLGNLRVLQIGNETGRDGTWSDCHSTTPGLEKFVRQLPRIEELHLITKAYSTRTLFGLKNLTNLRVLHVEHQDDYPVGILAKNEALANLETLYFHPHFCDPVYDAIRGYLPLDKLRVVAASPHLKKLTRLSWHCSSAGDKGIEVLIESGMLDRLKLLSLRSGCVRDAGARRLAEHPATRKMDLLDLRRNQLSAAGIAALQQAGVNILSDDQHPVGSEEFFHEGDFE